MTVCGQRDHGSPFTVDYPRQGMTGARIGCTELACLLQDGVISGTLLPHFAEANMLQCRPVALPERGRGAVKLVSGGSGTGRPKPLRRRSRGGWRRQIPELWTFHLMEG